MFLLIDGSIVTYLGTAYEHCQSNRAADLVINALSCLTKMSDIYGVPEMVDSCLLVLVKNTKMFEGDLDASASSTKAVEASVPEDLVADSTLYSRDELIGFIANSSKMKALLSAISFIITHYPNQIHDSWRVFIRLYVKLLNMGLLPESVLECEDFVKGSVSFARKLPI